MSGGAKFGLARRAFLIFTGKRLVEDSQDGDFADHAQGKIGGEGDVDDTACNHFGLQNMPLNSAIRCNEAQNRRNNLAYLIIGRKLECRNHITHAGGIAADRQGGQPVEVFERALRQMAAES